MDAWEYTDIEAARAAGGRLYHEFLRVPDLSAGIYVARGRRDRPAVAAHRGRAVLRRRRPRRWSRSVTRRGRSCPARWSSSRPASPHRFHDIAERLELLVLFGPAEGDRA